MHHRRIAAFIAALIGAAVTAALIVLLSPFGSGSPSGLLVDAERPAATVTLLDSVAQPQASPPPMDPAQEPDGAQPNPPPPTQDCRPAGPEPFTEAQILSYYGNPYTADMGILGQLPPQTLVENLKAHARRYDSLNGPRGVQPALHLVYATAQSQPYPDGLYLLYLDEQTLREYIQLACENGLLIFLDLQIGRSDAQSEVTKILPYLKQPHVNLALDPEFAVPAGKVPGQSIGSLDATDVNAVQALLEDLLAQSDLPDKILIVHQFTRGMLTRPELLEDYPRVKLVIDMDGFGPSEIKRVKYGWFAAPAENAGIKLFFRQDPDLMSEKDVLGLEPDLIIYQ